MIRFLSVWLGMMVLSTVLYAQEAAKDALLRDAGWLELTFDNKIPNTFVGQSDGAILVATDKSVSLLYKPISVDIKNTPKLSWDWKVDKSVPATDLSVKGRDDRSLAIYVSFPFDYDRAGFWERFIRDIVVTFKGEDTPGRVISYVWGGNYEKGKIIESPYLKSAGALIALKSVKDADGQWRHESVDVAKDYERIFGQPANQPYQIAISADSDDSAKMSIGWVKNIGFVEN